METTIFKKIYNSIPKNIFVNDDGVLSAAIDIYFTWCGIRPACIPFDGEVKYEGISGNQMHEIMTNTEAGKKCLAILNKIPNLKVIIGPYYDAGDKIVIYNTNAGIEPLLDKIRLLRKRMNKAMEEGKDYGKIRDQIHKPMGELLGYQCPMNTTEIFSSNIFYSIGYMIGAREHLGCWCPLNATNKLAAASTRLIDIRRELMKIKNNKIQDLSRKMYLSIRTMES